MKGRRSNSYGGHSWVIWGGCISQVRLGSRVDSLYYSPTIVFLLFYLGDYPPQLGLEKGIWFNFFSNGVGFNFVSDSEQNLAQSHFKIFFKAKYPFQA